MVGGLNQLFGNLAGLQRGVPTKKPVVPAAQGFRTDVQITHGDAAYDTAAEVYGAVGAAGVLTTIWEMTVPAQQSVHWGYGSPATPHNQGYMTFVLVDLTNDEFQEGTLRLFQRNARNTNRRTVIEMADASLHGTDPTVASALLCLLNNINQMKPLPEKIEHPLVGEDSVIGLEYTTIVAATALDGASFRIPITVYQ